MDTDKYKNQAPYPVKPKKPGMPRGTDPASYHMYADDLDAHNQLMDVYREDIVKWNKRQGELDLVFKADVLAENGLTGHPKADLVFSKAWEHGHSSGNNDVAYWVADLADLVL